MATQKQSFDESQLPKGQVRKLNALRRTLGDESLATEAFSKWLAMASQPDGATTTDPNAQKIADALQKLRESAKLSIPRGGYVVRSGRGRVIVEPAAEKS